MQIPSGTTRSFFEDLIFIVTSINVAAGHLQLTSCPDLLSSAQDPKLIYVIVCTNMWSRSFHHLDVSPWSKFVNSVLSPIWAGCIGPEFDWY